MLYKDRVRSAYKEAVTLHPTINSNLKQSLKSHERVSLFVDNLAAEFEKVDNLRSRKGKKPISEKHLKEVVYDMTNIFIESVEIEAKRRWESEIERHRREMIASDKNAIVKTAAGEVTGDFKDMGLTQIDSRDV